MWSEDDATAVLATSARRRCGVPCPRRLEHCKTRLHGRHMRRSLVDTLPTTAAIRPLLHNLLDQVSSSLRERDDRHAGMPRDLVREHRRVDDAERLNPVDAQLRVDRARPRVLPHLHGGRLSRRRSAVVRVVLRFFREILLARCARVHGGARVVSRIRILESLIAVIAVVARSCHAVLRKVVVSRSPRTRVRRLWNWENWRLAEVRSRLACGPSAV